MLILIMMGICGQPCIWCYRSADSKLNDLWISGRMSKTWFLIIHFHLCDSREHLHVTVLSIGDTSGIADTGDMSWQNNFCIYMHKW